MAAAGTGLITSYQKGRSNAERLEVIKLLVNLGVDVNEADDYGITALMSAANMGDVPIIQYLIDMGANLGAYDFGKKNDGAFGASDRTPDAPRLRDRRRYVPAQQRDRLQRGSGEADGAADEGKGDPAHRLQNARCADLPAPQPMSIPRPPRRRRSKGCARSKPETTSMAVTKEARIVEDSLKKRRS